MAPCVCEEVGDETTEIFELLTTAEVAARVRKHPKTVERAIRDGRLRARASQAPDRGPYGVAPEWIDEWIFGAVRAAALPAGGSVEGTEVGEVGSPAPGSLEEVEIDLGGVAH